MPGPNNENSMLRIEIDGQILAKMLSHRLVCASEIRCLDPASKKQIKRLCLKACAENQYL